MDTPTNFERNQTHYEHVYADVTVQSLVEPCRDASAYIDRTIHLHTSWVALYRGDWQRQIPGKRILELGCGNGLNALLMARLGAAHVTAVELAAPERAIREAAEQLGITNRLTLRIGDFADMEFDAPFDYIVGKMFLHHLTHEQEAAYLAKISQLLVPDGEARFAEPAVNSALLDHARWLVPVPGRPSSLQRRAFQAWKDADPHPPRDNSARHYQQVGARYFNDVQVMPVGGLERFNRVLPRRWRTPYRRASLRIETFLPLSVQTVIARTQTIIYRKPRPS